jgi:hypothetical protein
MMKHLSEYVYETVRVITTDGDAVVGKIVSYESAAEHDLPCDTISMQRDGFRSVIDQDYIASIEIIPS